MDRARELPQRPRQDDMETEAHYYRVGLYIIGLSVALALFTMWIMSRGGSDTIEYRIYFAESVSGLSVGSPVKYRGVDVGKVDSITISKRDPRLILVDVSIGEDTPVKTDTLASLKLQGITGAIYIDLRGSSRYAQSLVDVTPRGKKPVIPSEAGAIAALVDKLPQILDKMSAFADQLGKLTTDENMEALQQTFANLNSLTADLRQVLKQSKTQIIDSSAELNGTMRNLRKASRNVSKVTERVEDNPSTLLFAPEEQGIPAP